MRIFSFYFERDVTLDLLLRFSMKEKNKELNICLKLQNWLKITL